MTPVYWYRIIDSESGSLYRQGIASPPYLVLIVRNLIKALHLSIIVQPIDPNAN